MLSLAFADPEGTATALARASAHLARGVASCQKYDYAAEREATCHEARRIVGAAATAALLWRCGAHGISAAATSVTEAAEYCGRCCI